MNDAVDWPATVHNDKGRAMPSRQRGDAPPLSALIDRRRMLMGLGAAAIAGAVSLMPEAAADAAVDALLPQPELDFDEVELVARPNDQLPAGYERQVVVRWGDPLFADAPEIDFARQTAADARRQFGFNNDFTAFMPLPFGSGRSDHGLLVVNHEYPLPQLMFAGLAAKDVAKRITAEQVDVSMAACGHSILEIRRVDGQWRVDRQSRYNRRITAETPIRIGGPVAGHPKLRTAADPSGRLVLGTHDNCNGGLTPWGTILTCEEGSADFFAGDVARHPDPAHMERNHYESSPHGRYGWARFHERFDFNRHPNEPNRFEWVVEIDPFEPESMPVKRTSLGRFAHEGAHCALAADGRVAVYLGDDWEFEYCYRFLSTGRFDPADRAANRDLLDNGVLSVARFDADGSLAWLPLLWGQGPLTPANGFENQADVLLHTRRAADLLGATPMDSPEGYEPSPLTGRVIVALTGNKSRRRDQRSPANPRAANEHGHMLELIPPDLEGKPDHGADHYRWDVFLLCGDPANPADGATFHPGTSRQGWFVQPDNIAFDPAGRLWVCSDGPGVRRHDGLWAMQAHGPKARLPRLFYSAPAQSECCSPAFTPDGRTMFLSVQHPSERAESQETAVTHWPDFAPGVPPRPSVIVITRRDGGPVGG